MPAITVPNFTNQWIQFSSHRLKLAQNWLVVCASDGSPLKDSTNQHDNSEVNTIKCIVVSTTPSFLPGSPLKSANCPSQPLFRQSPLYFGFSWTPLPHLKTGFFRFLVNPRDIKTFLLLNISDFSFFYRKSHPLFPINLPLKIEILQRTPFLKILLESESPPQQIKKGGTL